MTTNTNDKKIKLIQKNQKMSTHFAWLTTTLIAIVSLIIAIFVLNFFNDILVELNKQEQQKNFYIASKIFDSIKDKYTSQNPEKINSEIYSPLQEGTIAYLTIKDRKNGTSFVIKGRNKYLYNNGYNDYTPQFITPEYIYTMKFFNKNTSKDYVGDFLNKLSALIATCIFLGLIMAYFMFKIVNKPLEELTHVAENYKKGNFSHKIQKTHYEEINTLIETYNSMGQSLKELYSSLEMKVEKRTVELEKAYKELQDTQAMMVHSEKMRSLGELVAGITHEINNPVNFIYGNLIHLKTYSENLINLIEELLKIIKTNNNDEILNQINELKKQYDFDFIQDDLPDLIKSCQDGADRTKNIIMNLKDFSRMGEMVTSSIDLANEIDITLNILHNKLKNRIEVHKDYAPDMPKIDAFGGQLNQVFMNILDNATYAIKDTGNIKISMQHDSTYVTIKIEDDGCGMDKETANRIFDPFFTTKPVGQGTGLGMSISYKIIKNHNGNISVSSEQGKGTTFTIVLPIVNNEITKGV